MYKYISDREDNNNIYTIYEIELEGSRTRVVFDQNGECVETAPCTILYEDEYEPTPVSK